MEYILTAVVFIQFVAMIIALSLKETAFSRERVSFMEQINRAHEMAIAKHFREFKAGKAIETGLLALDDETERLQEDMDQFGDPNLIYGTPEEVKR